MKPLSQRLKIIKAPGKGFNDNQKGQTELIRNNKNGIKPFHSWSSSKSIHQFIILVIVVFF